jgi:hypothetical protein
MHRALGIVAIAVAWGLLAAAVPAEAKTCKDAVTARARSSAQLSDASREKRAQEKAISNWSKRARDTYGFAYQFWRRAEDKDVKCGGGASAKHCTVSARPCRIY